MYIFNIRLSPTEKIGKIYAGLFYVIDHTFTLIRIIEKAREHKILFNFMFIDFNQAFVSISHENVWKALENQNIELNTIKFPKNLYKNSKAYKMLDRQMEEFTLGKKVKQSALSPHIYLIVY